MRPLWATYPERTERFTALRASARRHATEREVGSGVAEAVVLTVWDVPAEKGEDIAVDDGQLHDSIRKPKLRWNTMAR